MPNELNDQMQTEWDSEKRDSPYSTVCDPSDDTYCEFCDGPVVYSGPEDTYGTCGCDQPKED